MKLYRFAYIDIADVELIDYYTLFLVYKKTWYEICPLYDGEVDYGPADRDSLRDLKAERL